MDSRSRQARRLAEIIILVACLTFLALYASAAEIIRVVDGDTLLVRIGSVRERVRIAGIDAPELSGGHCERELAVRSADYLRSLTPVETPVEIYRRGHDRYGRILADVTLADGRDAGQAMIAAGTARKWTGRRLPWC